MNRPPEARSLFGVDLVTRGTNEKPLGSPLANEDWVELIIEAVTDEQGNIVDKVPIIVQRFVDDFIQKTTFDEYEGLYYARTFREDHARTDYRLSGLIKIRESKTPPKVRLTHEESAYIEMAQRMTERGDYHASCLGVAIQSNSRMITELGNRLGEKIDIGKIHIISDDMLDLHNFSCQVKAARYVFQSETEPGNLYREPVAESPYLQDNTNLKNCEQITLKNIELHLNDWRCLQWKNVVIHADYNMPLAYEMLYFLKNNDKLEYLLTTVSEDEYDEFKSKSWKYLAQRAGVMDWTDYDREQRVNQRLELHEEERSRLEEADEDRFNARLNGPNGMEAQMSVENGRVLFSYRAPTNVLN